MHQPGTNHPNANVLGASVIRNIDTVAVENIDVNAPISWFKNEQRQKN